MNRIVLTGRLGHEPELRHTPGGKPVLNLSIAEHRRFRSSGGERRVETLWHQAVAWGRSAETMARVLTKGGLLLIEGRLSYHESDQAGGRVRTPEIVVASWENLGGFRREASAEEELTGEALPDGCGDVEDLDWEEP